MTAAKTPVPMPPAPAGDLPALLRRHRETLRLSKRAMAARLGVEEATYLAWERAEHTPGLRALPGLLAALGTPPTPPIGSRLADRLRAWRQTTGQSQAEAAAAAGIDAKTLGTVERGGVTSPQTVRAIAGLLEREAPVRRS